MIKAAVNKQDIFFNPNKLEAFFFLGPDKKKFLKCKNPCRAVLYFKNRSIDLLTGLESSKGIEEFERTCSKVKIFNNYKRPHIFVFLYEYGRRLIGETDILASTPLALELIFEEAEKLDLPIIELSRGNFRLTSSPDFTAYQNAFDKVQAYLREGDSYQVNLTRPFRFSYCGSNIEDNATMLIKDLYSSYSSYSKLGAYAHFINVPLLNKIFVSNSPECLFQADSMKRIWSMPIKGTIACSNELHKFDKWKELRDCPKNQAELFMILDLIKNDLNKISIKSAKIPIKKAPLKIPGLVHQFGIVETKCNEFLNLSEVMQALFPGGSITGAPKKRTMQIIYEIEKRDRGFYCGSTVLLYKDIRASSINIRSGELDTLKGELVYQAGGGITVQSQCQSEFQEMYDKVDGFGRMLTSNCRD